MLDRSATSASSRPAGDPMRLNIDQGFTGECPECGSFDLHLDKIRGELLCLDCGIVFEGKAIDMGPEWNSFKNENGVDKARTGPFSHLNERRSPEMTSISFADKDHYGKNIPISNKAQVYRMRKWQRRIRSYKLERKNLIKGYNEIDLLSQALDVNISIRDRSKELYKSASEMMIVQGRGECCPYSRLHRLQGGRSA